MTIQSVLGQASALRFRYDGKLDNEEAERAVKKEQKMMEAPAQGRREEGFSFRPAVAQPGCHACIRMDSLGRLVCIQHADWRAYRLACWRAYSMQIGVHTDWHVYRLACIKHAYSMQIGGHTAYSMQHAALS